MKTEPATFYISIIDFFSVMMPGAIVTYLAKSRVELVFGSAFPKTYGEVEGWAVFLFSSYLLGHFIFLLGSKLDDLAYDKIRRATPEEQKGIKEENDKPPSRLSRWLAKSFFSKNADLAVKIVRDDKQDHVPDEDDVPVINAFQWAKARLTIQCPTALLEVQRFEAGSKFFRSLVVVWLGLAVWFSITALSGDALSQAALSSPVHSRLDALRARLVDGRWLFVLLCVVLGGSSQYKLSVVGRVCDNRNLARTKSTATIEET